MTVKSSDITLSVPARHGAFGPQRVEVLEAPGRRGLATDDAIGPVPVLAPNAKLRAMVVPQEPEPPAPAAVPAQCEASCTHHRPVRLSWARLLKRVLAVT